MKRRESCSAACLACPVVGTAVARGTPPTLQREDTFKIFGFLIFPPFATILDPLA